MLNPLNSSMISVALVLLALDFDVSTTHVTLVVSSFYLAAAVGQPLMGGLGDRLGPRRVFIAGMTMVVVSGVVGPFSQGFGLLLAARVLQAIGTSTAFPSAVALIRARSRPEDVQSGMSAIAMANSLGAALGPIIGGVAVAVGGWQALFWVNIPLGLAAALAVLFFIAPVGRPTRSGPRPSLLRMLDPLGVLLFACTVLSLLMLMLSIPTGTQWWLVPATAIAAAAFLWRELRAPSPFLDVRMLTRNRPLMGVYVQFAVFNFAYYGAFYGVPQWLEVVRGQTPALVGLFMLPLAAIGAIATPLASRLIRRFGTGRMLILGASLLVAGSAALLLFDDASPLWVVVAALAMLGLPYALCNLALQLRMNGSAPKEAAGIAAGLFQTSRYLGAILSTSMLGLAFAHGIGSAELHGTAVTMAVLGLGLVGLNLRRRSDGASSAD
ncbi:MFS transporter [Microbacterium soli]|uniref:MFS transporter n=1 Tax=Microbacterium soli TaxID=446075 RepID=A0ABP7MQ45_9MICO